MPKQNLDYDPSVVTEVDGQIIVEICDDPDAYSWLTVAEYLLRDEGEEEAPLEEGVAITPDVNIPGGRPKPEERGSSNDRSRERRRKRRLEKQGREGLVPKREVIHDPKGGYEAIRWVRPEESVMGYAWQATDK